MSASLALNLLLLIGIIGVVLMLAALYQRVRMLEFANASARPEAGEVAPLDTTRFPGGRGLIGVLRVSAGCVSCEGAIESLAEVAQTHSEEQIDWAIVSPANSQFGVPAGSGIAMLRDNDLFSSLAVPWTPGFLILDRAGTVRTKVPYSSARSLSALVRVELDKHRSDSDGYERNIESYG